MQRRYMLTAASTAAIPLMVAAMRRPAFAQATTMAVPQPVSGPLSVDQHKQLTLLVGALAMESSSLALQQGTDPRVKQFAGFEVAEQKTIAQVLTDEPAPKPVPLDPPHAAMLQSLAAMTGRAFDREYVRGQIQGHSELLTIQQDFLRGQPSIDTDAVHVAMMARTVIQMHLTMLQDLQQTLAS